MTVGETVTATATANDAALAFAESSPELTRSREITWQDPVPSAAAGAGMAGLDYIRALMAGELPPPPIAVLMRMTPVEVSAGAAVFEGEPGEEHYNPIGFVHGGYAATLLDSALGCAIHTTLEAGVGYTTLSLETKFQRPLTRDTGRVRAEAEVVHRGRRQATAEGRLVRAADGKLLATATATCLIIGP
ncbi:MAG: PaaI family thioesterase [Actinomycetota bacterium]|nr:PaaI family thioesterase [Actinomycetota bacterium]